MREGIPEETPSDICGEISEKKIQKNSWINCYKISRRNIPAKKKLEALMQGKNTWEISREIPEQSSRKAPGEIPGEIAA